MLASFLRRLSPFALVTMTPGAAGALVIEVPVGCGSAAEFEAEVRKRLGDNARVLERTELRIERPEGGREEGAEGGVDNGAAEHVLEMRVGDQRRTLRDVDCRDLFQAAVVVTVAIALSEGRRNEPDAPPEPATKGARAARAPEEPPLEARDPWVPTIGASAGSLLSFGLLPDPAFGLELEGRADWERFGVALAVRYLFPREEIRADNRGVRVRALGGQLSGVVRATPWLEGRVGFMVFALPAEGVGSLRNDDGAAWAAGPSLSLALTPLQGRLGWLSLGGEGHLELVRSEFEILSYGEVYSVPAWGGAVFFRAGLRFF